MLAQNYKRGFDTDRLKTVAEPKVKYDDGGFYINTISENVKVYFDDYYSFLEDSYNSCLVELQRVEAELDTYGIDWAETRAFYLAYKIILQLVAKNIRSFYSDTSNFGVVMTPWCFGTVLLEKIESYTDRLKKGHIAEENMPENAYYVAKYIGEIYKKVLLDLFEFPEEAFKMRWQYSELLKRYGHTLKNITGSLQTIMMMVKSYGV